MTVGQALNQGLLKAKIAAYAGGDTELYGAR